ncbi:D-alanyl-D-alanine carboxypeptidase family protein [Streptomyces sp. URMC 123]|uniref:D-alanyl-D-alanine carboxypeptidase family protein n=1 Tax=Streptomyces sp. URMC 123 TaxID=3423403 RepID=UPI003F1CF64C
MPAFLPTFSAPARTRPSRRAVALTAAAAVLLPALTAAPAVADPKDDPKGGQKQSQRQQARPPATMSTVGGARLGQPGTQVALKPGAPPLPMDLTGLSWIVADAESGDVLASHNAHWPLPPASTLKMLFADTVLPKLPKKTQYTVKPEDMAGIGSGSSMVGMKEHQTYSVHDMWLGVFLKSGNDAVHVLSAMNGGMEKTVREMQEHAVELNAADTHVVTPDGYDAEGQVSSAYDLTLIARSGLQKPDFREYCSTPRAMFPGEEKDGKKGEPFQIQNTNRLLTGHPADDLKPYPGIAGVKNGFTSHAGSTFTGVAQRGERVLLVTVMNPDPGKRSGVYTETAALFDWGFAAAGKVEPVGKLVAPRGQDDESEDGEAGGKGADGSRKGTRASVAAAGGSAGLWTALGITAGSLLVLAGAALLVHRRWPLPELVRRRRG